MITRLQNLQEWLRQSLWPIPALFIGAGFLLGLAMAEWDATLGGFLGDAPFLYRSGPESSLAILSVITSAAMAVAGVTFSITIVSLTLASSQFGPRLLRNFLRSLSSQLTFGVLVGTFVYGVVAMRGVGPDWTEGNAHPTVSLIILMGAACSCILIYYIHHVANTIQVDNLIASVYGELEARIDQLEDISDESPADEKPHLPAAALRFAAWRSGYIQAINCDGLTDWARKREAVIVLTQRSGKFIARGSPLAEIDLPEGASLEQKDLDELQDFLFIGGKRTPEQDLEFLTDQLVEIALRALSPGINDPITALVCVDYLGAALAQLARKRMPPRLARDEQGRPRLWIPETDYSGFVANSFDLIRQAGQESPTVIIRMAHALEVIANRLPLRSTRRESLSLQLDQLKDGIKRGSFAPKDEADIRRALDKCAAALSSQADGDH